MSELDLEEISSLLTNLGNVAKRVNTMATAVGSAGSNVTLPRGADLSGLKLAVTSLAGVYKETYTVYKGLIDVVKDAQKADQSWGDHFKRWLTPPKTGSDMLDSILSRPGSQAAGAADAVHDLGVGTWDLVIDFNPVSNVNAWRRGDEILPIQRPGLGLWNVADDPGAAARAFVGWQYHDDPERMQAYAGVNILATFFSGGLGEAAEAGITSRLTRLTARGAEMAELERNIAALEERLNSLPASRQRNPGKRNWVRHQKSSALRDLERAQQRLDDLRTRPPSGALRLGPATRWAIDNMPTMPVPAVVHQIVIRLGMVDAWSETAKLYWDYMMTASGAGNTAADLDQQARYRDRLREISDARLPEA